MGKGLIGNSLSYTMRKILDGEVSADDIDKIYASTCFTEDTMSKLISEYEFQWDSAARDRAEKEICEKYGVEEIYDLDDREKRIMAHKEAYSRRDELLPIVTVEAEELLHNLWDNNKIIQTRYRIPEGETAIVKIVENGQEREFEEGSEVVNINGELYYDYSGYSASLGMGTSKLFNSEIELIANQLPNGHSIGINEARIFYMQKLFPQYKDTIMQVGQAMKINIKENGFLKLNEGEILDLLNQSLNRENEHTAEEIGEGIKDLNFLEVEEGLRSMTNGNEEPKKEGPSDLE